MGQVTIVVGAQWGDEGKGKWIDILASKVDIVARFQGGNNAGHTLYVDGKKIVLHQLPSGLFHDKQYLAITAGVVIAPYALVEEIDEVSERIKFPHDRLWISSRAHVITPWSVHLDGKKEENASKPIGTTKKGIGPTYAIKADRVGLRMGGYVNTEYRKNWIDEMCQSSVEFSEFYKNNQELWEEFDRAAEKLGRYVCSAEAKIRQAVRDGKDLILEGAQGTLLDINHGTYPYVTSSSTTSSGATNSIGLSPKLVTDIFGIAKAYTTRVGEGPFPTELFDDDGKALADKGNEFGATTGRPRRCGWYDAVAMRHAAEVNGLDSIYLNKLDVLSGFKELKIATAYEHPTLGKITEFPEDALILEKCTPVYEAHPGWDEKIPATGSFDDLPAAAQKYVKRIEELTGVAVAFVGTGPNRENAIPAS